MDYPHGPLQRTELGKNKVQGVDYAYTLQGWLKGINSDRLHPANDPGHDGDLGDADPSNDLIGRDAYGLSLGYYGDADYKAIGPVWNTVTARAFAPVGTSGTLHAAHKPLYNGNIAHTVNTLQPFGTWGSAAQGQVLAQVYQYDQLNRLRQARGVEGIGAPNTWEGVVDATADRYRSAYEYDANGNIHRTERWNRTGDRYDHMGYGYQSDADGRMVRNRLYHINEQGDDNAVTDVGDYETGALESAFEDEHDPVLVNQHNNYGYDALGNLVRDDVGRIADIGWTVAGKVKHIHRSDPSTLKPLTFGYGASGQRILKQVGDPDADAADYREHYIRDAQGNIMATYRYTVDGSSTAGFTLTDRPLYGSSRLGNYTQEVQLRDVPTSTPLVPVQQTDLQYELTDHLGNVTAVVTGHLLTNLPGLTPAQAQLVSAQGYEPFGSLLPGRNYSSSSYNFGFQGQIKDDEIIGSTGTSYAFEYRIHDPRIGRFLSIDPLSGKYPMYSPYHFSSNQPLHARELEGLESEEDLALGYSRTDAIPFEMARITVGTVRSIGDAAWNLIIMGNTSLHQLLLVKLAREKGFTSTDGLRVRMYGGKLELEYEPSLGRGLLEAGGDLLAVTTAFAPAKGGLSSPISLAARTGGRSLLATEVLAALRTPRLQHAFGHAGDIKAFKGKTWSKEVGAEWEAFNRNVLESPDATFTNVIRGNVKTNGYYKEVDGQHIGVQIYAEGPLAGQLATTVVLSPQQMKNFGLQ